MRHYYYLLFVNEAPEIQKEEATCQGHRARQHSTPGSLTLESGLLKTLINGAHIFSINRQVCIKCIHFLNPSGAETFSILSPYAQHLVWRP